MNRFQKTDAFKRLKQLHQQSGSRDLIWHYDVGQQVQKLHPSDARRYGTSELESTAESLGQKASYSDKLVKARKFYELFDRRQVKALNRPTPEMGFVLSWSHLEALLPLEEKDREKLIPMCIEKEWSTRDLRRAIAGYRSPLNRGGRKFQKPADLATALRQLVDESSQWHRRCHEAWFDAADPAISPGARTNKQSRELAGEAIEMLKKMQHDIEKSLEILDAIRKGKKKAARKR